MAEMRLSKLCEVLTRAGFPVRLEGEDRVVRAVNTLECAGSDELSFLSNVKYVPALARTQAAAVIVNDDVAVPDGISAIRCRDPYGALTAAIIHLHGHRKHPQWGISPGAQIDPTAKIGPGANIAAGVTISPHVTIGPNCTIYPGCYVGERVQIGHDCILFPNVVIYDRCQLGDRVTIHAGSVIGEDGLGYAPHDGRWVKIPQIGRAVLGDDVEIGANCTIDRATLGQTEIGAGTKFGNVVVIGHGTRIGPDCLFVGLVGVAGSVTIGRHVTLAGQVGVAGHLEIGDDVTVGAQAGITGSVEAKATLLGSPAIPLADAKRSMVLFQKLPEMAKRIKDLEEEVRELRQRLDADDGRD
jgi:UDP-3-O-[3-hydroxymyristoyl] glucosamine N-acyltransferase